MMRTVALRFAENFAPECGTIAAHQEVIDDKGFVWYGELGSPVSANVAGEILMEDDPRILLIHSGGVERWWAHVEAIKRETPELPTVPSYYRNRVDGFSCWLKSSASSGLTLRLCLAASSHRAARCSQRRRGTA